MISFSNPFMLWSLLGLTIPIAIHFLSRKEGKVIMLGSVRHLEESPSQQFKGIKLNEYWLLLLRSLLIIILALLLAGTQYSSGNSGEKKWVVLEASLSQKKGIDNLLDSLSKDGFEIRSLAEGFPPIQEDVISTKADYYTLLEELKQQHLDKCIVISCNTASSFMGERMVLPENIQWLSISADPLTYLLRAQTLGQDSLTLRYGYTEADLTYFTDQSIQRKNYKDSLTISTAGPLSLAIYASQDFSYDKKIIEASLLALKDILKIAITLETITDPSQLHDQDWLIWLSEGTAPIGKHKTLSFHREQSNSLIKKRKHNQWILTQKLNQELALQQHLPVLLAKLFLDTDTEEKRALAMDRTFLPDSLAFTYTSDQKTAHAAITGSESLSNLLLLLLFSLLFIERVISYLRKQ